MEGKVKALIIILALTQAGCASVFQKGRLREAQDAYKNKHFATCLYKASLAQTVGSFDYDLDAKIMFVKAMCLDGLGERAASRGVFENIQKKVYPGSEWSQAAVQVANQMECSMSSK